MYSVTEQFVTWLRASSYAASTRPPDGLTEFVTVERTGGTVTDMVDHATIAIQTWAATETRAEEMANAIRLLALTTRPDGVHSITVNAGPYPFFDESTRLPRYQLALNVACQLTD